MTDRITIILDRIDERLAALGLSDRKASLSATGKPDMIRDMRRGKEPRASALSDLAAILQTTVAYLEGRNDSLGGPQQSIVPSPLDMPRDIPVYGTAIGSQVDYHSGDGVAVAVEMTDLNNGDVIDYFRRPPKLIERRDVYGLYTAGDSMAPAYESGDGLAVDPRKTPAIRDFVVVYLQGEGDHASVVLIKRLVRRSSEWIELEQFNPPATFRIDMRKVRAIHRVLPWDELFGF